MLLGEVVDDRVDPGWREGWRRPLWSRVRARV